jgi:alkylation response protein AidB-like acyl-CoA dehydrogenase
VTHEHVNLELSDDQRALRSSVASLLSKGSSPARVRAAEPLGFDPELWGRLVEVGVPGMATSSGGASLIDLAVVCEQVGLHVAPAPVVEAYVVARLLDRLYGCPEDVSSGATVAAFALTPARDGEWPLVPAGAVADLVVGLDGSDLVAVRAMPPGRAPSNVGASPLATRPTSGDRVVLAHGDDALTAHAHALDEWRVLTSAALIGLAQGALDLGVGYAKERRQFDAPIGSFQAVQQRLADVATALDGARLLAYEAAWSLGPQARRFPVLAAMSSWFTARTAAETALWSLHFHGGYGFMLEYDIQLYFRRSKAWTLALGDVQRELALVGERLFGGARAPGVEEPVEGASLDFRLGERAEAFRAEVRDFFAEHMTVGVIERVHETGTIHDWSLHRALAERGWLAAAWPRDLGGQERDAFEMVAFDEEVARAAVPLDGWGTTELVARTLAMTGTDDQRRDIIPRALRGEILISLGYSEPDAGSDVASVTTRAERDGDQWVVNGQKMFTTMAHEAHYVFLLTRTDPSLPKHRGLTMFLVPLDAPGVEIRAVHTLGGERTNITFYNDVRVPDSARVGEVNGGWQVMTVALAFERNPTANGEAIRVLERATAWARETGVIDDPGARERLARVAVENEVGRLLAYRMACVTAAGELPIVEGSMAKLFATEAFQRASADLLDLIGPTGVLQHGEPGAPADGWIEHAFRHAVVTTIYAGSSEIQRSIIAERGLGLPRSR